MSAQPISPEQLNETPHELAYSSTDCSEAFSSERAKRAEQAEGNDRNDIPEPHSGGRNSVVTYTTRQTRRTDGTMNMYQIPHKALRQPKFHLKLNKKGQQRLRYGLPDLVAANEKDGVQLLLLSGITPTPKALLEATKLDPTLRMTYMSMLLDHWDINSPLGSYEPPLLGSVLNDQELTTWLLERGADPNAPCDTDYTPLSIAAREHSIETILLLLKASAAAYPGKHNGHLIYHAVHRTNQEEAVETIRLLAQYGKPVDEILWNDALSYPRRFWSLRGTPLYYACQLNLVNVASVLLNLGANPDKSSEKYETVTDITPRSVARHMGGEIAGLLESWLMI